jgi:hypothetical protein
LAKFGFSSRFFPGFILAFSWLLIAVIGRTAGVPLGLDIWHQLWQPLFGPAIGSLWVVRFLAA